MQKKWYLQPEMIIAFSALITSLAAVVVSIYSAYIDRSYAKASVWPSLLVARSWGQDRYEYIVLNQGNGPAIVHYAKLTVDGQIVNHWQQAFEQLLPDQPHSYLQSHIGTGVIRPGQQIQAMKTNDPETVKTLLNASISAEICYCSIYDDCWLSAGVNAPISVEKCDINEDERFLQ
ncbi:MAG: hypothetical protein CL586_02280 [Alteromonadaceae bacterium]|jgi:hypothetical protein|nr:hypothetical protein [Alteromonadaceae bacterium]|tara:strand:- start:63 stop:590 length:528 start_codon:yes stop_codon:yes gene_type:complete